MSSRGPGNANSADDARLRTVDNSLDWDRGRADPAKFARQFGHRLRALENEDPNWVETDHDPPCEHCGAPPKNERILEPNGCRVHPVLTTCHARNCVRMSCH